MNYDGESAAGDFLELASEQRLGILLRLAEKKSNVSALAKDLDATVPEVYRNFDRLVKADLIFKDTDGYYHLTTYGKTVCAQIPSFMFVTQNKKYFKKHDFGDLPPKFVQRMGALVSGKHTTGFVKILEQWKNIYKNADKYIYNVLSEVPYTTDLIEPLVQKIKKDVKVKSIFSQSVIIPEERKKIIDKNEFKKFFETGMIERRIKDDVKVVVILNEKEACVMFPTIEGESDISEMYYGTDPEFHDWCLDYFWHCWNVAEVFQESKLKKT